MINYSFLIKGTVWEPVGRHRINNRLKINTPEDKYVLTNEDIIEIIKQLIELTNSKVDVDDIDHLSNRRVRTVGDQLANQFYIGLNRMARTIRDRMNVRDNEVFTPTDLINAKTLSSVINSFFGTSQLSQFMDQTNPLAEVTHKRRVSASWSWWINKRKRLVLRLEMYIILIMEDFVLLKHLKDQILDLFHHYAYMIKLMI